MSEVPDNPDVVASAMRREHPTEAGLPLSPRRRGCPADDDPEDLLTVRSRRE